ncbi:MAG: HAMP domain-containing protein [Elusimicrobia bacterium]|nr:HAMP domain-containing protein [Elusimicrobiota bacterium]
MNPFIPLRLRILGAFSLLSAAVLGASLWLVGRSQTAQVEEGLRARLETTADVFAASLQRQERQLAASLELLGGDFAFKQAFSTEEKATIASAAKNFQTRISADVMWVTDEDGVLLVDTAGLLKTGRKAAALSPVDSALADKPATAIVVLGDAIIQVAAVPIKAPDIVGVLAAGFRIGDAAAGAIREMTKSDVSFAAAGSIRASSLKDADRALIAGHVSGMAAGSFGLMGPMGGRWLVLRRPVSSEVSAYIQRQWDAALEPVRELRRLLLIVGLASLGLTVLAGLLVAQGVTAPMEALAAVTRRLVLGDYDARVSVGRRDEVGQLAEAFNSMIDGLREKERIRSVLRKAVSKEIADELLKKGPIELGGEERTVTVLFSDIRGFTTISEGLPPKELVSQLNAYFKRMARAIEPHRGVIDKFVGDAIMALFGVPLSGPDDAAGAQRAALAMLAALAELNVERRAAGQPDWRIGVGLNSGAVVAGTLGSEERWSYTVIGDAVNLASRLEGLTKHYGAGVVVSRATRDAAAGADFLYRSLDLVRVKGKHEAIEVFELLGEELPAPAWLAPSERGIVRYRVGDLAAARTAFGEVLALKPDDALAKTYLERLAAQGERAPAGWDPAHTMDEK